MRNNIIFFTIVLIFISCNTLRKKNFEPIKEDVFVFVGKKVSISRIDNGRSFDQVYKCKYKISEMVLNDLGVDTIEFVAYNHYGRPYFEEVGTPLLYLLKDTVEEEYTSLKYQFDEVEINNKGKWCGRNGESLEQLVKNRTGLKIRDN